MTDILVERVDPELVKEVVVVVGRPVPGVNRGVDEVEPVDQGDGGECEETLWLPAGRRRGFISSRKVFVP